jgi:co-chaperonin GroES (HSP10)
MIEPRNGYLICREVEPPEAKTEGGVVLPDNAKHAESTAIRHYEVVAPGESDIAAGEVVIASAYAGLLVGRETYAIHERDLVGVIK